MPFAKHLGGLYPFRLSLFLRRLLGVACPHPGPLEATAVLFGQAVAKSEPAHKGLIISRSLALPAVFLPSPRTPVGGKGKG